MDDDITIDRQMHACHHRISCGLSDHRLSVLRASVYQSIVSATYARRAREPQKIEVNLTKTDIVTSSHQPGSHQQPPILHSIPPSPIFLWPR